VPLLIAQGKTALMAAVEHGRVAVVKLLLKSGAPVFQKNHNHETALDLAHSVALKHWMAGQHITEATPTKEKPVSIVGIIAILEEAQDNAHVKVRLRVHAP
jgi:hypothetical protein